MNNQRRKILASMSALPLIALHAQDSAAQSTTPYRALVCIRLDGGNDGFNTVVPLDTARYNKYSSVRGLLALPRGTSAGSLAELAGSGYGLHPSLARLVPAWNEGALSIIHNVGPLSKPITQQEFLQWRDSGDNRVIPQSLFSHSDQTILWDNADISPQQPLGWGGMAVEQTDFDQVISLSNLTRFAINRRGGALVIPYNGAQIIRASDAQIAQIRAMASQQASNILQEAYRQRLNMVLDINKNFGPVLQLPVNSSGLNTAISTAFTGMSNSSLTKQLFQVAKLIDNRSLLRGSRHIFFVQLGGFDTHGHQIAGSASYGLHADLLAQVGEAMSMFWDAMKRMGLANQVTMFTTSDFGRTFKPNSSPGTDHGWGNEHLVLGGGVIGGTTYGTFPDLTLGGPDDAGNPNLPPGSNLGRWIPTTSVDQYASTLLSWWNPQANINAILPNISKFATRNMGFMKA